MPDLKLPDLNTVTLAGRLTRDPELRYGASGSAICKLGIAVSRSYKCRDGDRKEESLFIDAVVFDKAAEYLGQRLAKGAPVLVDGRLKMEEWTDKATGQKRSKLGIVAQRVQELAWPSDSAAPAATTATTRAAAPQPDEEDIPF